EGCAAGRVIGETEGIDVRAQVPASRRQGCLGRGRGAPEGHLFRVLPLCRGNRQRLSRRVQSQEVPPGELEQAHGEHIAPSAYGNTRSAITPSLPTGSLSHIPVLA